MSPSGGLAALSSTPTAAGAAAASGGNNTASKKQKPSKKKAPESIPVANAAKAAPIDKYQNIPGVTEWF